MKFQILSILFFSCFSVLAPAQQTIDCMAKGSTEDRQTRIAILAQNGVVKSFALYSKWKPKTCSIDADREDRSIKWTDSNGSKITTVKLSGGEVVIHNLRNEFQFEFKNIDMMKYCGIPLRDMNGTMVVKTDKSNECTAKNLMPEPKSSHSVESESDPR